MTCQAAVGDEVSEISKKKSIGINLLLATQFNCLDNASVYSHNENSLPHNKVVISIVSPGDRKIPGDYRKIP